MTKKSLKCMSATVSFNQDLLQIAGDGKELALLMPTHGVFLLREPIVTSFSLSVDSPAIFGMSSRNSLWDEPVLQGPTTVSVDLSIIAGDYSSFTDNVSLIDYKMAKNMSVRELFQAINKKIEKRQ